MVECAMNVRQIPISSPPTGSDDERLLRVEDALGSRMRNPKV